MQTFNYHTHTYRCRHADWDYTDEGYVLDYIKMGFRKIAFTDHCPQKTGIDKRRHMRMADNQREGYLANIQRLKEKYADKIEILSGYEIEYLPEEETYLRKLKAETDMLILGQHFICDEKKNLKIFGYADFSEEDFMQYAKCLETAMQLRLPDMVAHPDIFMLLRKEFGKAEEKTARQICQAAEKYKIPLEINLNNIFYKTYFENRRLNHEPIEKQKEKLSAVSYPCKGFWEIAAQYDITVLYGIDAHHKRQICLWHELRELANEILGKELISKLKFMEN